MNETIQGLFERKSMRVFTPETITLDDKNLILDAAIQAPTAGNLHLYTILDITDQTIKNRLAVSCDNQPFIATAPLVLIFCADLQRLFDGFERLDGVACRTPGQGDLLLGLCDALIAAQNAVVAAHSLGIGSCYIGDIIENCEEQRELLRLPDFVIPIGMLVFGHPVRQQLDRKKPMRFQKEFMVRENTYRRYEGAELKAMFDQQSSDAGNPVVDVEKVLKAVYTRKFASAFALEMDRSAALWIKPFTDK